MMAPRLSLLTWVFPPFLAILFYLAQLVKKANM